MEDIAEEPYVDIDGADEKNPLAVVEYIDDIYAYYKKVEVFQILTLTICLQLLTQQ